MAYENLKSAIKQAIKQNDNQEITGDVLQSTLLNIVNTLGADYKFLGFASPSTVPPTREEGRLFYFASEVGEYPKFPTSGENTYITIGEGLSLFTKEANSDYWKEDTLIEIAQDFGNSNKSVLSQAFMTEKFNELFTQQNKFLPNRFNISITKTWKATIDSKKTDISLYKGVDYSIKLQSYNGTSSKIIAIIGNDVNNQFLLELNKEVNIKPLQSGPLVIYTYPNAQEEASVVISISTKEYANHEKEVSGLTNSVSGLTNSVSGLNGSVSGLTNSVSSLTNSVSDLDDKVNIAANSYTETVNLQHISKARTNIFLHKDIKYFFRLKNYTGNSKQGVVIIIDGDAENQAQLWEKSSEYVPFIPKKDGFVKVYVYPTQPEDALVEIEVINSEYFNYIKQFSESNDTIKINFKGGDTKNYQKLITPIYLEKGETIYLRKINENTSEELSAYIEDKVSPNYIVTNGYTKFTAAYSGYLVLRINNNKHYSCDVLFTKSLSPKNIKEYVVSKDGNGDFTTITGALKALKNNVLPKIIKINGGEYDVFAEQGGEEFLNSVQSENPSDWIKYNDLVPDNTEIIGIGTVIIKYELPDTISQNKANIFSALNIRGNNVRIENIIIIGKNCRYCLHDENGTLYPYNNHIYKNCRFSKSGKGSQAVGIGFSKNTRFTFEKCILDAHSAVALFMHTNDNEQDYSNMLIDSCAIISDMSISAAFECSSLPDNGKGRIAITINSSYINKKLEVKTNKKTSYYDIISYNSNIPGIVSDAITTLFPPNVLI